MSEVFVFLILLLGIGTGVWMIVCLIVAALQRDKIAARIKTSGAAIYYEAAFARVSLEAHAAAIMIGDNPIFLYPTSIQLLMGDEKS